MTEFKNIAPSILDIDRKLTEEEVIRAIRVLIADEFEATINYEKIINATNNDDVKKVLEDIRKDELRHKGQLEYVLQLISELDRIGVAEGVAETERLLEDGK